VLVRVYGWTGALGAARSERVKILQLPALKEANLLLTDPAVRACIEGSLAPNIVLVKSGKREALTQALAELGVALTEGVRAARPPS
jgi:hypothetical protein